MASEGDSTSDTIPGVARDGDAVRIYGGYKAGDMSVAASFETVDTDANADATYMFLVGKYKMSAETELAATSGTVSADATSSVVNDEGTGITLGVFQTVAPKTQLFVSMSTVSLDTTGQAEP